MFFGDQALDGIEYDGKLLVVHLLHRLDLARELTIGVHQAAQLDERAHDGDVDLHGAGASGNSSQIVMSCLQPMRSPHSLEFVRSNAEHEIGRKTFAIAGHRLIERSSFHAVQRSKICVQKHALAAYGVHQSGNGFGLRRVQGMALNAR